jgi:hypothetical protein
MHQKSSLFSTIRFWFIILADRVKTLPKGIPARRDTCLESGMSHITGHDRFQTLLLPESLDEYVGAENPVRFIDAFVDGVS